MPERTSPRRCRSSAASSAGWFAASRRPSRFRFTSIVFHLDRAGLQAVPIVALISFLIGGIIAQQGVFQLRFFGAEDFVVDLVGILVLRELGVLLTAILLAGRSGSAYTAEIGSMKMREELDALKVIGLDPIEVLIMPRLLALIIALPLLTFVSDICGLVGGAFVTFVYGDMAFERFILLLRDAIDMSTLMTGLIKAPFMGLIVGLIAANEGPQCPGQRRVARPPHHLVGGQGDLHGHRRGRHFRHLFRGYRLLTHERRTAPIGGQNGAGDLDDVVIRVRGLTAGFDDTIGPGEPRPRRLSRRDPRRGRSVGHRQDGASAHDSRPHPETGRDHRDSRRRPRDRRRRASARRSTSGWGCFSSRARCFRR